MTEYYNALIAFFDSVGLPGSAYNSFLENAGVPPFPFTVAMLLALVSITAFFLVRRMARVNTIIDSSGRVFGKVNIIDVAIVIAMVLFGANFSLGLLSPNTLADEREIIYVTILSSNTEPWFIQKITIGDFAGTPNKKTAIVTDVKIIEAENENEHPKVFVKFKLVARFKGNQWWFKRQKLVIGNNFKIDTALMKFDGTIINIELEGERILLSNKDNAISTQA